MNVDFLATKVYKHSALARWEKRKSNKWREQRQGFIENSLNVITQIKLYACAEKRK